MTDKSALVITSIVITNSGYPNKPSDIIVVYGAKKPRWWERPLIFFGLRKPPMFKDGEIFTIRDVV